MKENWEKAIKFVLNWEGGYSNHPNDPGGLTIYGISARSYPKEVERMEALWKEGKKEEAKQIAIEIYKKNYWDRCQCDTLPYPLDILVFDTAVNMGVGTAQNLLKACGKDYREFLLLRINRYKEIALTNPKARVFLLGWLNRTIELWKLVKGGK